LRSSIGQLKDFKESTIWLDISDELDIWLHQIHQELENGLVDGELAYSARLLDRLGGSAEAVRNFHNMIDVLIDLAEDSKSGRSTILNNLTKGR
jgi:arabinogalactan endo-1,4-beta-galactosidase